jgi:beta-phosphoglucomutase-like phosphatase (HAD superfamily)
MEHDISYGVKGLIFDLDGTLVDTMPFHFEAWKNACHKFGTEINIEFLLKHTGSPSLVIATEIINISGLTKKVTGTELLNEKMLEFSKIQHLIKPIPVVTDIVKKYFGRLPMAIGTGGHRNAAERTLEITGLRKYFNIIITANDIECFKPDPETFLKCARLMKIEPRFIEVFEDTSQGLEAASLAGMIGTDVRTWYNSNLGTKNSIV